MNLLYRTSCSSSTLTQLVHHPEGCLSHLPNAIKIRGRPDPPPENPERIDTLVKERMGILHSREFKINTKITFIEPVGYFDMLELLKNCTMVVTDSGGLQKEAFFSNKNCIIVREETEWLELVTHNFAKIVGTNKENMLSAFQYFLTAEMDFSVNLFGENVGKKIHDSICNLIQE